MGHEKLYEEATKIAEADEVVPDGDKDVDAKGDPEPGEQNAEKSPERDMDEAPADPLSPPDPS